MKKPVRFRLLLAIFAYAVCSVADAVTARYSDAGPKLQLADAFSAIGPI